VQPVQTRFRPDTMRSTRVLSFFNDPPHPS
jgi:hypothetical protein